MATSSQKHIVYGRCSLRIYFELGFICVCMHSLTRVSWLVIFGCSLNDACLMCSVPIAGEMLSVAEQFLEQQMHPTIVISAYRQALDDMLSMLKEIRYCIVTYSYISFRINKSPIHPSSFDCVTLTV